MLKSERGAAEVDAEVDVEVEVAEAPTTRDPRPRWWVEIGLTLAFYLVYLALLELWFIRERRGRAACPRDSNIQSRSAALFPIRGQYRPEPFTGWASRRNRATLIPGLRNVCSECLGQW